MTFTEEKQKQSSDRFVLARLEPARDITGDLVLVSGGTYQATFSEFDNVSKVEREGATLTEVTTITGNDEYTFDEDTGLFTVQLASAPNETTNVLILFHYLYLTTERGRYFAEDPLTAVSSGNPTRFWEPRIERSPTIEESYKNIINAVMTIKASSLSIINPDQYLNPFLTKKDSFKNKTLTIWIGINDELEKIFTGPMNDISLSDNRATVRFRDAFSKINQLATYGGDIEDIYYTRSQYTDIDPRREDTPKVHVIGVGTPGKTIPFGSASSTSTLAFPDKSRAVLDGFNLGTNIDYATSTATTGNRDFHLFRSVSTLVDQSVSGLVRQTTSVIRGDTVHHYFFSSHNLRVGQTFKWDDGGGPYYAIVHHVGTYDISGSDYNVMVANNGSLNLSDPLMTDINDFDPLKSLVVIRAQDTGGTFSTYSDNFLKQEDQYTLTEVTSPYPTANNVEVELDSAISFDVDSDSVYWSAEFNNFSGFGSLGHSRAIRFLLNTLEIDTNDTSFSAAQTALPLEIRMQVPKFGTTELPLYREIIEDISGSALTYLSQNEDGEAEIGVLESPVAGSTRDDSLVISGSQSVGYGYNDIYQTINYSNRHAFIRQEQDVEIEETSDNRSIRLHGENRTFEFEHVLDDISTRIGAHLELRSSRQATYSYTVATEDIDTDLGEDITLESDKITPTGSENVKITSIKRSADRIQVKATDLGDLS